METIHLNAQHGVRQYCEVYGDTIHTISSDSGPIPDAWKMQTAEQKAEVDEVTRQLEEMYPKEKLDERKLRRDKCLAALAKLKKELPK